MMDNIVLATNSIRSSVGGLKRKLSSLRVQVEAFDAELEKIDQKFDVLLTQADIYKSKLQREMGREVRRLEKELALLRKNPITSQSNNFVSLSELRIASTVGIFDSLLRHICVDAEDFRMASESFLFPAIYERVVLGTEEAYFLDEIPSSMYLIVQRGREHVKWVRDEYYTHITNPETWQSATPLISDWWRNDALPLLYGARDEQWDIDEPLSLQEMMVWRDSPADRPLQFSAAFDAFEIYAKHKDAIFETSGIKEFEMKNFTLKTQ